MKTVMVEVEDQAYAKLMDLLAGLARDHHAVSVCVADDEAMTQTELDEVTAIRARVLAGDDDDFEDWTELRRKL